MTDASQAFSAAPLVAAIEPIIIQCVAVLIAAAIAWAASRFSKATGVTIQAAALDRLTKAAQTEAGAAIAAAADNLAGAQIHVGSPVVAAAATKIVNAMPDALKAAGITPSRVADLVAGELGKLQATMTVAAAPQPSSPKAS